MVLDMRNQGLGALPDRNVFSGEGERFLVKQKVGDARKKS